jgi:hypothetical protein
MVFAAATGSGRGRVLAIFGPRTGAAAFEETAKGADAGERAHQRTAADGVSAPRREEGAHVSRGKCRQVSQGRRAAQMIGEEMQELQYIAPVGFDRFARKIALGAEMPQPSFDLHRDFAGDQAIFRSLRHIPVVRISPRFAVPTGRMNISATRLYPS